MNGHTNGAIELAPDSRPNYARLRIDTPTMRGNYAQLIFSSKRSIRTMDHFAEVEEYFDGDTALLAAIGGRTVQKPQTNHMGDFNAIIDFPPAPKLDALNRLDPGEGDARRSCAARRCSTARRSAPPATRRRSTSPTTPCTTSRSSASTPGRPEGPIKTFPLRGIKDSPPYLHDGRLLTLEDAVVFFDIVLQTRLTADEKRDLVAYLRML